MSQDLMLHQRRDFGDDLVETEARFLRRVPLGKRANTPDDFSRALAVGHHVLHAGPHFVRLRRA
jgi:hypothetical protein